MNNQIENLNDSNCKELTPEIFDPQVGFVYQLLDGDGTVVFIGYTKNLMQKIYSMQSSGKPFCKVRYWEVSLDKMHEIAAEQILKHRPFLNGKHLPSQTKYVSFNKAKSIFPILKGKFYKARKILVNNGCHSEHLSIEQWQIAAEALEEKIC